MTRRHMLNAEIRPTPAAREPFETVIPCASGIEAPVALALTHAEVEALVDKLVEDAAVCDPGDPLASVLAAAHVALIEIDKETRR